MKETEDLAYVLRGKNRIKVLKALNEKKLISKQIEKETGMYKSHVSRTLKELLERKLITCINQKDRSFKFYKLTSMGTKLINSLNKMV
ncbi:MAG: winged helix-turn-helix domain-containing protein [Candidatus ainarchaeum sp.]|nr:winged helix-turn-helix domain-containing protein [Candidatus ainarchaeum sp.]